MTRSKRQKLSGREDRPLRYDPVVILAGVVGRMAAGLGFSREQAHRWMREALAFNWSSGGTATDFKAIRRAIERPFRQNNRGDDMVRTAANQRAALIRQAYDASDAASRRKAMIRLAYYTDDMSEREQILEHLGVLHTARKKIRVKKNKKKKLKGRKGKLSAIVGTSEKRWKKMKPKQKLNAIGKALVKLMEEPEKNKSQIGKLKMWVNTQGIKSKEIGRQKVKKFWSDLYAQTGKGGEKGEAKAEKKEAPRKEKGEKKPEKKEQASAADILKGIEGAKTLSDLNKIIQKSFDLPDKEERLKILDKAQAKKEDLDGTSAKKKKEEMEKANKAYTEFYEEGDKFKEAVKEAVKDINEIIEDYDLPMTPKDVKIPSDKELDKMSLREVNDAMRKLYLQVGYIQESAEEFIQVAEEDGDLDEDDANDAREELQDKVNELEDALDKLTKKRSEAEKVEKGTSKKAHSRTASKRRYRRRVSRRPINLEDGFSW